VNSRPELHPLEGQGAFAANPEAQATRKAVVAWVKDFLTRPHPALGRSGEVCPFTTRAVQLDTIRIGECLAGPEEAANIQSYMRECFRLFEDIPCTKTTAQFRAIIVAFPNCDSEAGLASLAAVQRALTIHTVFRPRMLGFFHAESEIEGLRSPAFRPMRAPVPVLAIRELTEYDAPFIARARLLVPIYLWSFGVSGLKRLSLQYKERVRRGLQRRLSATKAL
jgi:hypothetical protein